MITKHQYDVIILGAGPVGALLALLLAQQKLRVALLESQVLPAVASAHRVSAVNQKSCDLLDSVECLLPPEKATPFTAIEIFEKNSSRLLQFTAQEIGQRFLGKIIENHALTKALQQQVKERGIDFICPVTPKTICVQNQYVSVETMDHQVWQASLLVGADGAHSWVRHFLGFTFDSAPYHEFALVAEITTTLPHHQIAGQFFLSTGPVAFLPLQDPHKVSLVWSGPPALIDRLMHLPEALFCSELTQTWEHKLGEVTQAHHRARFELTMRHVHEYARERVALVGDALHTIHPLAGQGLNLGIADAASLAQILISAKARQQDVGQLAVLRQFSRARRAPNTMMLLLMKGFQQGFKLDSAALVKCRQFLLKIFENVPILKRTTLRYAVGQDSGYTHNRVLND